MRPDVHNNIKNASEVSSAYADYEFVKYIAFSSSADMIECGVNLVSLNPHPIWTESISSADTPVHLCSSTKEL